MALFIAIVASEVTPFSKAGGLADVANALPKHLKSLGHDPIIITPYFRFMDVQNLNKEYVGESRVTIGKTVYPVKFLRTVLPNAPVPVYFVYQEQLFSTRGKIYDYPDDAIRFAVFDLAVLALFRVLGRAPDIIHCHDWQTGLIPNYLRTIYAEDEFLRSIATVFTIHNLLFQKQGMWYNTPSRERDRGRGAPPNSEPKLKNVNFTLRGIKNSDIINTVSERYATEILTKKFGEGLDGILRKRRDRVFGIINGIDYTVFNPSFDQHLSTHYDWNSLDKKIANKLAFQKAYGLTATADIPLIGLAHRLTEQKGFSLLMTIMPSLLKLPVQLVIVGAGDRSYVNFFRRMARLFPQKVAVHLEFSEEVASRIYAASDMFLMPSRYEPCGISQLISLRYGSVPIVHQTGGLADTITDFDPRTGSGNGFVFTDYTASDLLVAIARALETYKYPRAWEHLTWQAMRQSFSWQLPAKKYVLLYKRALKIHHAVV